MCVGLEDEKNKKLFTHSCKFLEKIFTNEKKNVAGKKSLQHKPTYISNVHENSKLAICSVL